jgi:hypothetical protein
VDHYLLFSAIRFPLSGIGSLLSRLPWRMFNVMADLIWYFWFFCSWFPTWLVASAECRGRKSLAALRDEKARRLGQVEVFVVLFLVYEVCLFVILFCE